jgi:ubiquinone/menaquinone biosynthesis C-methylase UbiE
LTGQYYQNEQQFWDKKGNEVYLSLSDFDQSRIQSWIGWQGHGRVLDIGGGSGMVSRLLTAAPETECVCIDISLQMLTHSTVAAVQGDALHLPFCDACFDLVVAAAFFHHLPGQEARLLSEIARILKPGGRVVGYDPSASCLQNRLFMGDTRFRLKMFSPDERPLSFAVLEQAQSQAGLVTHGHSLFSFRNRTLTPFEIVQRCFLNPIARWSRAAPLLHRWFFWEARKPDSPC